jgi:hypothetical protein
MTHTIEVRHTQEHVDSWRRDGGVLIENFFTPEEVAAVRADFHVVFGRGEGGDCAIENKRSGDAF